MFNESSATAYLFSATFLRRTHILQVVFSDHVASFSERADPRLCQVHEIGIAHTNAVGESPRAENDLWVVCQRLIHVHGRTIEFAKRGHRTVLAIREQPIAFLLFNELHRRANNTG